MDNCSLNTYPGITKLIDYAGIKDFGAVSPKILNS